VRALTVLLPIVDGEHDVSGGRELSYAVQEEGLVKRFGKTTALAGVDLAVPTGTIVGVLGPNGAGKTTAVRILATLLRPDGGHATVGGYDVVRDAVAVRGLIGLTGQYASVDQDLSGRENLVLIGRLLELTRAAAKARARDLLHRFALSEAADRAVKTYSGGMRRRLDLAASLVGRPAVLYLDEPTTGLDPHSRNQVWAWCANWSPTG
jgi:oleandomycin transport system ATP-binding protein